MGLAAKLLRLHVRIANLVGRVAALCDYGLKTSRGCDCTVLQRFYEFSCETTS